MNPIHIKDLILYFITANVFFFFTFIAQKDFLILPFGLLLLAILIFYLIRMQQKFSWE